MSAQQAVGPAVETKVCKRCGETLPLAEFPTTNGKNWHAARCRPCHTEWKRVEFPEGQRNKPRMACEIPAGPFVKWLGEFIERAGSEGQAAMLLRTNSRILFRWTKRPMSFIPEETVDKVFCMAGEPQLLRELYPELDGDA